MRLRDKLFDGRKRGLIGAGGEHIAAHGCHAEEYFPHLCRRLAPGIDNFGQARPQAAMMIDLGEARFLVRQVSQALHGLFGAEPPIPNPLQHLENRLCGHDRDPASSVALAGSRPTWRVRQAAIAACITVFRGTS